MSNRNHHSFCICESISNDLVLLLEDVIFENTEQQWEKFEIFINDCTNEYPHMIGNLCGICHKKSFLELFIQILRRRDEFELNVKLSTLLANVLIYQNHSILKFQVPFAFSLTYDDLIINQNCGVLAALNGYVKYMQMLVYLDLIPLDYSLPLLLADFAIVKNLENYIYDVKDTEKLGMINRVGQACSTIFFPYFLGSRKRIYLTTVAIQALQFKLRNEENKANDYIHCLRLYFAATRDPFLTINEVRCMLYPCLVVLHKIESFEFYCEEFAKLLPECPVKFEPRKLSDIVRCQIREDLRKKRDVSLPHAIEELGLPQPLKRFVQCVEIGRRVPQRSGKVPQEHQIKMSQLLEQWIEWRSKSCFYSNTKTKTFRPNY